MNKKNYIKIPKNVTVFHDIKKKIISFKNVTQIKSLKLKLKINIFKDLKLIEITKIPYIPLSTNKKKWLISMQGTTVAIIKQLLIELVSTIYKKLKFIGVGYRAFNIEEFKNKILMFKLGYSHPLFFKIPQNINFFCLKFTKLFIFGNSYQNVNQISSLIQSYKKPEPYKGKGILYETEKIILKEGKKV
jgi:large subunit ribosomal protein L6